MNPIKLFKKIEEKIAASLSNFNFSISLIPTITTGVATVIFVSGLTSSVIFYTGMRSESLSVGHQNLKAVEKSIEENIHNYFGTANSILNSASNTATQLDLLKDQSKILTMMRNYLIVNQDVAAIYCALDKDGSFYMAKRMPDNSFSLRTIKREKKKVVERWQHSNPHYEKDFPKIRTYSLEDGYDPRKRSWYIEAFSNDKDLSFGTSAIWTSPYVFSSDKKLGITTAKRLVDDKKRKIGVFAVDLTLEKMSALLSSFPLVQDDGGYIFLTDSKETILANSFPTVNGRIKIDTNLLWQEQPIEGGKRLVPITAKQVAHPLVQGILFSKEQREKFTNHENKEIYSRYEISEGDFLRSYVDEVYKLYYNLILQEARTFFKKIFYKDAQEDDTKKYKKASSNFHEQYLSFYQGENPYIATIYKIYPNPTFSVNLNIIYPFSIIVDPVDNLKLLIQTTAVPLIIFTILLSILFARGISLPILRVSEGMLKIKNFKLTDKNHLDKQPLSVFKEILEMQQSYASMNQGLISFKKYVPTEIVSQLIKQGQEAVVNGEKALLTILFSDIQGFTKLTEKTPSDILIRQLRTYFNQASTTISEHQGTLDKYIGDSVMAFWGAPQSSVNHAINACLAALTCRDNLIAINRNFAQQGFEGFYTRFGINTGDAIVGNIGSDARLNYTAIGDSVNIASRLEGLNKIYRTQILISERTYQEAKQFVEARLIDQVAVYGRKENIRIYELVGRKGQITKEQSFLIESFSEAFSYIENRKWREAIKVLNKISSDFPEDEATKILLLRCYEIQTKDEKDSTFVFRPKTK